MRTALPLPAAAMFALMLLTAALFTTPCNADSFATTRSYLPLHDGNVWRYVSTDTPEPVVVEVRAQLPEQVPWFADDECLLIENYLFGVARGTIAFADLDDGLCEYRGGEFYMFYPWSDLTQPVGIPKIADDCMHGAQGVFAPVKTITVPAGRFDDALAIDYTLPLCVDAGPAWEVFVPGVGLVQRKTLSIAGVTTWSLYYAKVDGVTYGDPTVPDSGSGSDLDRDPEPVGETTWSTVKGRYR